MVCIKLTEKGKRLIYMCHYPRSNLFSTRILELIIICEGEMEGMGSRGGDGRRRRK